MTTGRWCNLTNRFGGKDNRSPPTDAEFVDAASAVLDEARLRERFPALVEADLVEHPNAWLEAGAQDGPMHVLDLYRGGTLEFVSYSDADMSEELARAEVVGVDIDRAVALWKALRDGRLEEVEVAFS